jgi:hypothetical protein
MSGAKKNPEVARAADHQEISQLLKSKLMCQPKKGTKSLAGPRQSPHPDVLHRIQNSGQSDSVATCVLCVVHHLK